MDKNLATILIVFGLIIGFSTGFVVSPTETKEVVKEVFVDVPVEVEVEKLVADSSEYLNLAVEDFMGYVDDEELFECSDYEYNIDEISIVRVYDNWNLDFDDEDYTVAFSIKLEYDEDDERSCKKVYEVEAYYEADEDVEVSLD